MLKWLGAAVLVGAAGFAVYHFVWPLVFPKSAGGVAATRPGNVPPSPPGATSPLPSGSGSATSTAPNAPVGAPPTDSGPASGTTPTSATSDPRARGASPPLTAAATTTAPAATGPSGAVAPPGAIPTPTTSAPRATTSVAPAPAAAPGPSGAPKPPPAPRPPAGQTAAGVGAGGGGRALLQSGKLDAAAKAFQKEILSTSSGKFTIALGLYCNEENAGRIVASAGASNDIYVLPASVQGRTCYRIVWGLFDTREAAERGIGSIPGGVHAGDAAPVAIARFLQ